MIKITQHTERDNWREELKEFFSKLPLSLRRKRFHYTASEQFMMDRVDGMKPHSVMFVENDQEVVGVAELFLVGDTLEFAVTILEGYQGEGFGSILLIMAINLAHKGGYNLIADCETENKTMIRMLKRHNASFTNKGTSVTAKISKKKI